MGNEQTNMVMRSSGVSRSVGQVLNESAEEQCSPVFLMILSIL